MRILSPALKFYSILWTLALVGMFLQRRLHGQYFLPPSGRMLTYDLPLGLGVAAFILLLNFYAHRNFQWAQILENEFRRVLVPMRTREILLLSVVSGTVEETLFRGALQPFCGIVLASLLFGLVHFVPRKAFVPWFLYAAFIGFLLGSLFEVVRNLMPVILAHAVVNFVGIQHLNRRDSVQLA